MRTFWIVAGSIFTCLVVVAVIGIFAIKREFGHLARGLTDPGQQRAVAAKIGTFRTPRGYQTFMAMDLGLVQQVTIVPADMRNDPFMLVLTGSAVPTSDPKLNADMALKSIAHQRSVNCDPAAEPDETATRGGKAVTISVYGCGDTKFASASVPTSVSSVTVTAVGVERPQDHAAFVEILQSLK